MVRGTESFRNRPPLTALVGILYSVCVLRMLAQDLGHDCNLIYQPIVLSIVNLLFFVLALVRPPSIATTCR